VADHDAELDALVAMLESASMVEQFTDDDGKPSMRLTQRGAQVGRAMAMAGDDADADAVLTALLDAQQ
jgi:predicted dinucleotide-binding enzyme